MFGLINVAIQCFVEDTYGRPKWESVTREAGLDFREFEAMLPYPDEVTEAVLDAAEIVLRKDQATIRQDIGTYLVTHKKMETVRRMLRYGGRSFEDFLMSLDELSGRVGLSIPDLEVPQLSLQPHGDGTFCLRIDSLRPGYGDVMMGIVQGLADDYGALVLTELTHVQEHPISCEMIEIELLEASFGQDRGFNLAAGMRPQ